MKVLSHLIAWVWLVCAVSLRAAPLWAQGGYPQSADRYVNDFAGLLSDAQAADIRARFSELNASHGIEAVIVTVRATRDYSAGRGDFDAFARGLFDAWGIGDRSRNDGALLLVGLDDRKTRIELGAGYRHRLDGEMRTIVDSVLLPKFRARQFGEGIVAAARAMAAKLEADALGRGVAKPAAKVEDTADRTDRTDQTSQTDRTDAAGANGAANAGVAATPAETPPAALLAEAPLPAEAAASAAAQSGEADPSVRSMESIGSTQSTRSAPSIPSASSASSEHAAEASSNAAPPAESAAASSAQRNAATSAEPPVSHPPTTVYHQSSPATHYTHSSPSPSGRAMAPLPLLVFGFLFVAVLTIGIALARRLGKRKCPSCQVDMVLLDEVSDDVYLNSGQQLEERLGSINYAVYRCPACGMHSIEPQRRWFSKYSDCPQCGLRALESDRKTLSHPTEYSTGSQLITRRCRNCNHFDEDVVILPRLEPAHHSRPHGHGGVHGHGGIHGHGGFSHGGGMSGGSGHSPRTGGHSNHGGGRSGGGGASGSW